MPSLITANLLKGISEDIRLLDWQILRHISPAFDVLYNIFTSTDKALRDKEYKNLVKLYYDTLAKTVELLGSNPEELFTFEDLQSEFREYGNFVLVLAPVLLSVILADTSEIVNLDEMCDKVAEGTSQQNVINGLKREAEYEQRLSDVIEDITRLGYYKKLA